MKLVRLDGTVPAIFFPPGKKSESGTCQFSSRTCRKNCPSQKSSLVDEIYKYFVNTSPIVIAADIAEELENSYKNRVLHWFSSGDCEISMITKIIIIIKFLAMSGVVQCGFTRNEKFWNATKSISKVNIILTVENLKKAKDKYHSTIIGVPNYNTGVVKLYYIIKGEPNRVKVSGGCGGSWYEDRPDAKPTKAERLITEPDCTECYMNKRGCFYNYKEVK